MNSFILRFITLFIFLGVLAPLAHAGKGRSGTFDYTQSRILLKKSISKLQEALLSPQAQCSEVVSNKGELIKLTLSQFEELSTVERSRNNELLWFDYQTDSTPKIQGLKTFYETFKETADADMDKFVATIAKRLLHETSHVWGLNESEAEHFATVAMNDLFPKDAPTNIEYVNLKSLYKTYDSKRLLGSDSNGQCEFSDEVLVKASGSKMGRAVFEVSEQESFDKKDKEKYQAFKSENGAFEGIITVCRDRNLFFSYTGLKVDGVTQWTIKSLNPNSPQPFAEYFQSGNGFKDIDGTGISVIPKACGTR